MRAQHDLVAVVVDDHRVPDVAGRMIGGDVEHVEVVFAGFDFGPEDRLETEVGEDLAHLVDHLRDRMNRSDEWLHGRARSHRSTRPANALSVRPIAELPARSPGGGEVVS